jgi:hypothetical protein
VSDTGTTMDAILRDVTEVTTIMKQIASASEEQSKGISQVGIAITQMDGVTQQNASLVEEVCRGGGAGAPDRRASALGAEVPPDGITQRIRPPCAAIINAFPIQPLLKLLFFC